MKKSKDIQVKKTKQGKKALICNLEKTHLQIFDVWGQRIFESSGLTSGGVALLIVNK